MSRKIRTFTGLLVDPLELREGEVRIADIAHALSLTCRFGGMCRRFYSVAEHSVRVADLVPQRMRRAALLHDAAEAYLGDVTSPWKDCLFVQAPHFPKSCWQPFADRELMLLHTIFLSMGVRLSYVRGLPKAVREADLAMRDWEGRDLMEGWQCALKGTAARPATDFGWAPDVAEAAFLKAWFSA